MRSEYVAIIRKFDKGDSVFSCTILDCMVAGYSHCSCSYSLWCSINWRRDRRPIPQVCIQWNVSLLGGQQTVSLNFLPTSSIPTKFPHLFAGKVLVVTVYHNCPSATSPPSRSASKAVTILLRQISALACTVLKLKAKIYTDLEQTTHLT